MKKTKKPIQVVNTIIHDINNGAFRVYQSLDEKTLKQFSPKVLHDAVNSIRLADLLAAAQKHKKKRM